MEKNICASLERFILVQTHQFSLDKSHYEDLNEIVDTSREIVHQVIFFFILLKDSDSLSPSAFVYLDTEKLCSNL